MIHNYNMLYIYINRECQMLGPPHGFLRILFHRFHRLLGHWDAAWHGTQMFEAQQNGGEPITSHYSLVGGLEHVLCSIIYGIILRID